MVTRVLESAGGPCSLGEQPGGLTLERGPAGSPAVRGVGRFNSGTTDPLSWISLCSGVLSHAL